MVYLKTDKEIEIMAVAGKIAASTLKRIIKNVKVGVQTQELDKNSLRLIEKMGGRAAFKKVAGYKHTICTTPNDQVVHGPPGGYSLKEGDILGIDLGVWWKGYNSDVAETIGVGRLSKEKENFLKVGRQTLEKAIKVAKAGNHIGDISYTIQGNIEKAGYSVVKELVGHGVGKKLHEDPLVPGIGKKSSGIEIKTGMVLAIEVIYNLGKPEVYLKDNGWTVSTKDRSISGLFERTVAITEEEPLILTPL